MYARDLKFNLWVAYEKLAGWPEPKALGELLV